ncbi:uncharacterized protein YciI [Humitalea rosea]|uniref:Uncharacterized protein YciI n=1 Tax=Humitalea rosea TaxID=990373 RepID=A0A2W7J6Y5_9PROT|nr:YciI family protein [Humitalea rosea]PZW47056.1 uncharacterized protein YciI [Humitalea rosea]
MEWLVLGHDRTDAEAPARRLAAMPRQMDLLRGLAAADRLSFTAPMLDMQGGRATGSLVVVKNDAIEDYLTAEPFETVWERREVWRFLAARSLAFPPLPGPGAPPVAATALVALDGTDAGAAARRQAARPLHFDRVGGEARCGRLLLGGALLDEAGGMIGSLVILAMAPHEAFAWAAADPYVTCDVWRRVSLYPTVVACLA